MLMYKCLYGIFYFTFCYGLVYRVECCVFFFFDLSTRKGYIVLDSVLFVKFEVGLG